MEPGSGSGGGSGLGSGSQSIDIEAIITNAIARSVRDNSPHRGPRGNQGVPDEQGPPGEPAHQGSMALLVLGATRRVS